MDGEMTHIEEYLWRTVQELQTQVQQLEAKIMLQEHTITGYRILLDDDMSSRKVEQMQVIDERQERDD
jgi:hypothetical protein